jgi:hypothetical protein
MTKLLTLSEAREWLASHGLGTREIEKVIAGIDPTRPVYLETLWAGDTVVQFRDLPSASFPLGDLGGQWFALPAIEDTSMGKLGIGPGLAGRSRHVLRVLRQVEVLESTARAMSGHPTERYVGPGGATQMFLPDRGLSSLL